jgi:hypothetical protein
VDAAALDAEVDAGLDAEPDAPADAGTSIAKFCHELSRGGHPVVLTLELGDPAAVRIPAMTGRCAPPRDTPCAIIPAGQVRARLFEGDKMLSERQVVLGSGKEFVFQAAVDNSTLQVVIIGGQIATGTCSGLDFPEPDGGAPPAPDAATD